MYSGDPDQGLSAARRAWQTLVREPLVQFAAPASLLFVLYTAIGSPEEPEIVVSAISVETAVSSREEAVGRTLDTLERRAVLENLVDQEVLLREAYAQGLDQIDGKVRERLVTKMYFLIDQDPREPTAAELAAFYREHESAYRTPPSLTVEHVFFSDAPSDVNALLAALRDGADPSAVGERFWLGPRLERMSLSEMAAVLGDDFTTAVDGLEPGVWQGPVSSTRGTHLVRTVARYPSEVIAFDVIAPRLRDDWRQDRRTRARNERLAELRSRYRVVIEGTPERKS